MRYSAIASLALVSLALQGSLNAQPATKNVFPATGLTTPIGIAYSPLLNKLLVTQTFCGAVVGDPVTGTATGFNIAAIAPNGSSSPFATLPDIPLSTVGAYGHNTAGFNNCFEEYIAVSPGLGGFPANQVYVTQGQTVFSISPTGSSRSTFVSGLGTSDTETGITFDKVGSFCNDMIVTGANGVIYLVNSAGLAMPYATISSTIADPTLVSAESSTVAPLSFTPYGGYLLVTIENSTNGPGVAAIQPPTACSATGTPTIPNGGVPKQYRINNQPSPEAVLAVPASATSCQFGSVNAGSLFSITYTNEVSFTPLATNSYQIVSYPGSDFSSLVGDIVVANEGIVNGTPPKVDILVPKVGGAVGDLVVNNSFDTLASQPKYVQLEGVTFVGCPTSLGCVLTPGGYKNHFNYKVTPLIIGGHLYTAAEVTTIVSTGGGGINALGRSLATALLNIQYGAAAPASVTDAITAAQKAIFDVTTGATPQKTIFTATLSNAIASPLNDILDAFNNGSAGQKECTQ